MAEDTFGGNQGGGNVTYSPSDHKFTDPIRYFKANDPYYWEVDNIPITQLQENILWLKDQIGFVDDGGGNTIMGNVTRKNFIELRPFASGGMTASINPGRFIGRVNDAYGTGISQLLVNALMNYTDGQFDRSRSIELPDNILFDLVGASVSGVLGNNGLYDHLQTHVANFSINQPNTIEYQNLYTYDLKNDLGINSVYDIPKIKLALWQQDTTTQTYYPEATDLQQLAVEYTRAWGAPFRTALVDVDTQLDIEIPQFEEADYANETSTNAGGVRIDLLFVYTKPVDASSTTIAKANTTNLPANISAPTLGIVRGAGLVNLTASSILSDGGTGTWNGQPVGSEFLDSVTYSAGKSKDGYFLKRDDGSLALDDEGNPQISSPMGDTVQTSIGTSGIYGNFPSPDDLMNLAPYLADEIAGSKSFALIGQSVLPIAYIFVRRGQVNITGDDILDIRPFFRTTELTYNERSGLAAANPPASLANPVVTDRDLQKRIFELQKLIPEDADLTLPQFPRTVAAGTIFGGLKYGVEGALLRMGAGTTANNGFVPPSTYGFNTGADYNANKIPLKNWFTTELGYTEDTDLPLNPDWDTSDWAKSVGCDGGVTDYINTSWVMAGSLGGEIWSQPWYVEDQFRAPQFNAADMENWVFNNSQQEGRVFSNPGIAFREEPQEKADGPLDRYLYNGTQVNFVRKRINIDKTDVQDWMGSYDVLVEYTNCAPAGGLPPWNGMDDADITSVRTNSYEGFNGLHIEKYPKYFNIVATMSAPSVNSKAMTDSDTKTGTKVDGSQVGDYGSVMHPINVRDTSKDQFGWWNAYAGYVVTSDLQKGLLSTADQTLADKNWNKVSPLNSNFAVCAYPTVKFTVIGYPHGYRSEGLGGNNPTIKLNPAF